MSRFFILLFLILFSGGFTSSFHLYILNKNQTISSYPGEKTHIRKKRVSLKERKKIKEHLLDKNLKAIIAPISYYETLKKDLSEKQQESIDLIFFYPTKKQEGQEIKKVTLKKKIRKKTTKCPKEFSHVIFFSNHQFEGKFLKHSFSNFSAFFLDQNIEGAKKIASFCDDESILLLPDPFFATKELKKKIKALEHQVFLYLKEKRIDSIYLKYYSDPKMMRCNFYQTPKLKLDTLNLKLKITAEAGRYFYITNTKEL